jgi:hypothetical protein
MLSLGSEITYYTQIKQRIKLQFCAFQFSGFIFQTGRQRDSELTGSKRSPNLICCQVIRECNYDLILSYPAASFVIQKWQILQSSLTVSQYSRIWGCRLRPVWPNQTSDACNFINVPNLNLQALIQYRPTPRYTQGRKGCGSLSFLQLLVAMTWIIALSSLTLPYIFIPALTLLICGTFQNRCNGRKRTMPASIKTRESNAFKRKTWLELLNI